MYQAIAAPMATAIMTNKFKPISTLRPARLGYQLAASMRRTESAAERLGGHRDCSADSKPCASPQ
jgi:hypothetical protein